MKTELALSHATLTLHRFPYRQHETLQAWDAGDEYLLQHIDSLSLKPEQQILVINDSFGALSCALSSQHQVTMMSDSFIARQATIENLQRNQCREVNFLNTMADIPDNIDLAIMQIPRNNRHLTWLLARLKARLPKTTTLIAVNKAKEIHTSTLQLFERYLGDTKTSLAWKKHRLVFCQPTADPVNMPPESIQWSVDDYSIMLENLPNVYSGERLDLGARFLLPHLPQQAELTNIIDLGCGNGVLSVRLAQLNPQAHITAIDESYMAIESTSRNLKHNLASHQNFHCQVNNCLDGFDSDMAQLIVCNPPFHQQQAITDHIAWQMFCDAKRVLANNGKLLIIGNRHLGYDSKLKRLFGRAQVKTLASNPKFVILQAIKR